MSIKTKKALAPRVLPKAKTAPKEEFVRIRYNAEDYDNYELYFESTLTNTNIVIESTEISCGIKQVHDLEDLASFLNRARNDSSKKIEFDAHILQVLDNAFSFIKEEEKAAFLIMSNKLTNNNDKLIEGYLDQICASTKIETNPNSGNKIKMWIY